MSTTLLLVILVIVLLFGFGGYSYYTTRNNVGHLLVAIAVIVIVLMLVGVIPVRAQDVVVPYNPPRDYTPIIVAVGTLVTTIITGIIAVIAALRAGGASSGIVAVKEDVRKIELATNSMKDALVAATAIKNLAQGRAEGIATERANPQVSAASVAGAAPVRVEVANADPVAVRQVE